MRRLLPLISAFMIVLALWTGTGAHAAEAIECSDAVEASAAGHFEGDGDEVPADSDQGTPHHHSACHGHCVATPSGAEPDDQHTAGAGLLTELVTDLHLGTGPGTAIRPPIA